MYTRNNNSIIALPPTIWQLMARFEEAVNTPDNLRTGRPRARCALENIERIAEVKVGFRVSFYHVLLSLDNWVEYDAHIQQYCHYREYNLAVL